MKFTYEYTIASNGSHTDDTTYIFIEKLIFWVLNYIAKIRTL